MIESNNMKLSFTNLDRIYVVFISFYYYNYYYYRLTNVSQIEPQALLKLTRKCYQNY